ncbi:MAG: DUF1905 domain-containing protein [Oligoflexia bacterium]|nr:DUF1905 domain-containing protein [Oligoflexia bacterium]
MASNCRHFKFRGKVWLYNGAAAWHFITLPQQTSNDIRKFVRGDCSAWGSIKVVAKVAKHSWHTSIFPDRKLAAYLLPLKKEVRKTLGVSANDQVLISLQIKRDINFDAITADRPRGPRKKQR